MEFDSLHPQHHQNMSRLSGTAKTLTFGAQTGRGSEKGRLIRCTQESKCSRLIQLVHSLAQSTESSLPHLRFQVLMLEAGQELNQHRDYHNYPDFPNHTLNFGEFSGGRLEMLREGAWNSYARTMVGCSFDALKVVHWVTPVTEGVRYSVTLHTPGKQERLVDVMLLLPVTSRLSFCIIRTPSELLFKGGSV